MEEAGVMGTLGALARWLDLDLALTSASTHSSVFNGYESWMGSLHMMRFDLETLDNLQQPFAAPIFKHFIKLM